MDGVTALEQAVIDMLLSGDHPALPVLRAQAERSKVLRREYTGVGFWTFFDAPEDNTAALLGDVMISGVDATIAGLRHGAGFILFLHLGRLDWLEGFTYDEPWPEAIVAFELKYSKEPRETEFRPWKRRRDSS